MPREGHDLTVSEVKPAVVGISIHVPREGHDQKRGKGLSISPNFNPRAPRGARQQYSPVLPGLYLISIHVPREGHDVSVVPCALLVDISIHVPREGHDLRVGRADADGGNFNPRAPRGARQYIRYDGNEPC